MQLLDFSQLGVSTILGVGKEPTNEYYLTNEQLCKHLIYNKIRAYNQKFSNQYGDMVICLEGKNNWRYESFQYYKHNRKTTKAEDVETWTELYRVLEATVNDLIEFFPFAVLRVNRTEADDVLATLARYINEPNIIISSDKDFMQLLSLPHVSQYDPRTEAMKKLDVTPEQYILEHVLGGDRSDGIPNILSPDNFFLCADGVRQKSITKKYKEEFIGRLKNKELTNEEVKNFKRNSKLINLSEIPKEIKVAILEQYSRYEIKGNHKTLLNYFIENQYTAFVECVNEF
jgi:5'-3' exonuclease